MRTNKSSYTERTDMQKSWDWWGKPQESNCYRKLEEAKSLDFSKSIRLYSQTTKSLDEFSKIVEYIKEHISSDVTFEYYDTICRQVANRIPNIRKFAASHDLVFFVSGKKSSNGKSCSTNARR